MTETARLSNKNAKMEAVITRRTILGAGVFALASCTKKVPGFDGYVFVANQEGRSLAIVDMAAFATIKHIRFDAAPTAVVSHPDKPFLYVLTPENGTLHEIDTKSMTAVRRTQAAATASAVILDPEMHDTLYVLSPQTRRIIRVPLNSFRAESHWQVSSTPTDFDLSDRTGLCAVAFGGEGSVSLIDRKTGKVEPPMRLSSQIGAVRFRTDGKALLVADLASNMITFVQTPGGRIMSQLPLALRPDQLCFNQDGGQLFVTGEGRDAVVVIYPYKLEVAETVLAGRAPGAMGASVDYLFIANPLTGDVSILHIRTRKLVAIAPVGAEPGFVTVTPNQQYALVLNRKSGDMAVIRIGSIKTDRAKSASLFTMIPVGSQPVSAVVRTV